MNPTSWRSRETFRFNELRQHLASRNLCDTAIVVLQIRRQKSHWTTNSTDTDSRGNMNRRLLRAVKYAARCTPLLARLQWRATHN